MIGPRLSQIAAAVPQGLRVADIGCDHAYLVIELVKSGHCPWAVASDINAGPLEAARQNVRRAGLTDKIELRLGSGLSVLSPGEVEAAVIAGMGGALMADILGQGREVVGKLQVLVVSPNVAPWLVRRWAADTGCAVADEKVVEEANHFYEILTLRPQHQGALLNDAEIWFGPKLLHAQDALTTRYFAERRETDERKLSALAAVRTTHKEAAEEFDRLTALWKQWEAERACR